jgi:hypothetical protein
VSDASLAEIAKSNAPVSSHVGIASKRISIVYIPITQEKNFTQQSKFNPLSMRFVLAKRRRYVEDLKTKAARLKDIEQQRTSSEPCKYLATACWM